MVCDKLCLAIACVQFVAIVCDSYDQAGGVVELQRLEVNLNQLMNMLCRESK